MGLTKPILWASSTPKKFCELFGKEVPCLPQGFVVTPNEIKRMKAKKFWNKGGDVLWVDDFGYIYSADKNVLPNKYNKAEWERFHDNPNAVKVRYILATLDNIYGDAKTKWFDSQESFLNFYESEKENVPVYAASPYYEILRVGYKRKKPGDCFVILRLPYIDLNMELTYGTSVNHIALSWSRMCCMSWQGNGFNCNSFLMDIIERYRAYMNK